MPTEALVSPSTCSVSHSVLWHSRDCNTILGNVMPARHTSSVNTMKEHLPDSVSRLLVFTWITHVQVENAMQILRAADSEGDNSLAPHTPVFTGMRGGEPAVASGPTSAAADATSSSGSVNSTDHVAGTDPPRGVLPAGLLPTWTANSMEKAAEGRSAPGGMPGPATMVNQPRRQPGAKPYNNGISNRAPVAPPSEVKRDLAGAMAKLDITK